MLTSFDNKKLYNPKYKFLICKILIFSKVKKHGLLSVVNATFAWFVKKIQLCKCLGIVSESQKSVLGIFLSSKLSPIVMGRPREREKHSRNLFSQFCPPWPKRRHLVVQYPLSQPWFFFFYLPPWGGSCCCRFVSFFPLEVGNFKFVSCFWCSCYTRI